MNADQSPSSGARNGSVVFAAILTVLLTTAVPGVVFSYLITYVFGDDNMKGGRSGSFTLGLVATFYVAVAFCGGTILSSPFLLLAHIGKPWHSGLLALAATAISYVLLFTGVTNHVARLFNFHTHLVDLYEPIAAVILVQFVLIAVSCLFYRISRATNVA